MSYFSIFSDYFFALTTPGICASITAQNMNVKHYIGCYLLVASLVLYVMAILCLLSCRGTYRFLALMLKDVKRDMKRLNAQKYKNFEKIKDLR